jgi:hypothetical protein
MELRGTGEEEMAAAAAGEVAEGDFFTDALPGDFFVVDALRGAEDEELLLRGFALEDARRVGAIFNKLMMG